MKIVKMIEGEITREKVSSRLNFMYRYIRWMEHLGHFIEDGFDIKGRYGYCIRDCGDNCVKFYSK